MFTSGQAAAGVTVSGAKPERDATGLMRGRRIW